MMKNVERVKPIVNLTFKTSLLRLSLSDYSDSYIIVSWTITVGALAVGRGNNGIEVVFKSCALFTNCISEINYTQIDRAKYTDVVMPMYNLIECSDSYPKTSRSLWQYCRDESALNNNGNFANFPGNSASFKFIQKIAGSTGDDGTKYV